MSERPKGKEWKELLKRMKVRSGLIRLDEWEKFNKTMRDALKEAKRYKKYTKLSGGAAFVESVLDHSWNSAFLCDVMLGIEEEYLCERKVYPVDNLLNTELLRLAARIHDLPEGLTDDVDIMDKKKSDEDKEDKAFELIIAGLPKATQKIYREAYALSQEWGDAGAKRDAAALSKVSKNGRFFAALEIIGYLSRGFLELKAGNYIFGNIFHNWKEHIKILRVEFASVIELIDPLARAIEIYLEKNPYFEE